MSPLIFSYPKLALTTINKVKRGTNVNRKLPLCGAVSYQLNQEINAIVFCHCSRCRKETGSAFNTAAIIETKNFAFIQGGHEVKKYSFQGVNRHFCPHCGSKLMTSRDNAPDIYRLRVGTLDTTIYPDKKIHVFTVSKASWDEICDNYPQVEEGITS